MSLKTPTNLDELHAAVSKPDEAVVDCVRRIDGDFLVLGAGGKMGFHLARMLQRSLEALRSMRRVRAVSRFSTPGSEETFNDHGIATIPCDLTSEEDLANLPDSPNVFFLAGIKFGTSDDPNLLQTMNVEMPQAVAERFSQSRIVALSTGCVYPYVTVKSGGSVETDPTGPVGDYATSCLGRETAFVDASKKHGTLTSLIRLNYAVDLRYGVLVDIARKVLEGKPVDVTMGYLNAIWQGDALAHIIRSLEVAASPPAILNVTGTRILSVRDIAKAFGSIFDKEVSIVGEEEPTAWLNNASATHQRFGQPSIDEIELTRLVGEWLSGGGETLATATHFETRDGNY